MHLSCESARTLRLWMNRAGLVCGIVCDRIYNLKSNIPIIDNQELVCGMACDRIYNLKSSVPIIDSQEVMTKPIRN